MTQTIHQLSPQQAQQIAAGEVVERPANIVKELLENSLDAGATTITLHIEKAGKKLIRITDDGCGMSREDALLCFSRHATSKLTSVDELMNLDTFGFRGEALASISSVSVTTLTTKTSADDTPLGTRVIYEHGIKTSVEDVACPIGTTIEVADLFATIPVRKTFLKQDETEWNQIMAVITGLALTYQDRSLKVFKDGSLFLNAPKVTSLRDRITQLWGHNLSQQLTEVTAEGAIHITGLISQPPFARYGSQQVVFFVNNRLVKNSDLRKAILKGYKQSLPPGKFPAACLFITTDSKSVDVNIHPRKEEVRFTKPGIITRTIQEAITEALERGLTQRLGGAPPTLHSGGQAHAGPARKARHPGPTSAHSAVSIEPGPSYKLSSAEQPHTDNPAPPVLDFARLPEPFDEEAPPQHKAESSVTAPRQNHVRDDNLEQNLVTPGLNRDEDPAIHSAQPSGSIEQPHTTIQKTMAEEIPTTPSFRVIGQLFATYIIIELNDELILVDQHAAHERILYHQFAHTFSGKEGTQLLFPQQVTLSEHGVALVNEHADFFADQGIQLHQAGPTSIAITSAPPKLQNSLSELIHDSADFMIEHESLDRELFSRELNEHVHSHMSCKAAIRAGDRLDHDVMEKLVEQLMKTPNRFMCVHGRPTMLPFQRADLEKQFRRR